MINNILLFATNSKLVDDNKLFSCERTFNHVIKNLQNDFHRLNDCIMTSLF